MVVIAWKNQKKTFIKISKKWIWQKLYCTIKLTDLSHSVHIVMCYIIIVRRKCTHMNKQLENDVVVWRKPSSVAKYAYAWRERDAKPWRKSLVVQRNRSRTTSHQSFAGSRPPSTNRSRSEQAARRPVYPVEFVLSARGKHQTRHALRDGSPVAGDRPEQERHQEPRERKRSRREWWRRNRELELGPWRWRDEGQRRTFRVIPIGNGVPYPTRRHRSAGWPEFR